MGNSIEMVLKLNKKQFKYGILYYIKNMTISQVLYLFILLQQPLSSTEYQYKKY
jgi:hypothetical protein